MEQSTLHDDERLLRLLEIHFASTPHGAASTEFWRAEQDLLDDLPLDNSPAIFLIQAMPLATVLNDLRDLEEAFPHHVSTNRDALSGAAGIARTSAGLTLKAGNLWRIDIRPNAYVGLAIYSDVDREAPHYPHFWLKHLVSRIGGFGDLCQFVARLLAVDEQTTWRLRCTTLNGRASLLKSLPTGTRVRGPLPDQLIDIGDATTSSIAQHLDTLHHLLDETCKEYDVH